MDVVISVNQSHRDRMDEVAAALTAAGVSGLQRMDATGIITGTAGDPDALRAIDGVEAVEASRTIDIGPPDAPVQ